MKKALIILSCLFLTRIGFYGCKKGENDPFISFKSRDKRMMGKWTVSNIEWSKITNTRGNTINQTTYSHTLKTETSSFDGSTLRETEKNDYSGNPSPPPTSDTETDVYSTTITLTLDKHGVAKATETSSYISTTLATSPTVSFTGCIPGVNCDGTYTYSGTILSTTNTYDVT